MPAQQIHTHCFENGLTLIVERMPDVQSAAFSLLVPAGSIHDPARQNGSASVLCDLITRGAGPRDSRELSAALDNLGVQRSEGVGGAHLTFSGATLADNLPDALRLYRDIVLEPHLPEEQFEAAVAGVEQTLRATEDEPQLKIMTELKRRCYDLPWGLPPDGNLDDLPNLTPDSVRSHYDRCFRPNGTILGIAGRVEIEAMIALVGELFGPWPGKPEPQALTGPHGPARDHLAHDSTQTQIGMAWPTVPYRDPEYYAAWAAVSVLSGGMSARLFTEVREKRGLCYAISAGLNTLRDEARVLCYAGTTAERAQETLDVTLDVLTRLADGIGADELARCQARAKSDLIMQQESTMRRVASMAREWYFAGRVTTLAEVRDKIERLTVATVLDHVRRHPVRDLTILTIGPDPLNMPPE